MILASILIGPPGRGDDLAVPPPVARNVASLIEHHPALTHQMFSGEDIAAFLEAAFPREVAEAYRALRPLAYKADLARYCILYERGGIYADLGYLMVRPVPFDGSRPVVFRDLFWSAPWDTNNSVIAAPPRHKALARAIELVCANVRRRHYGANPLCPTGPTLFGKALAETCEADELVSGLSAAHPRDYLRRMHPDLPIPDAPTAHCLMLGGEIVAMKQKRRNAGGLGDLGIAGSDDYVARWKARDVYEGDR